MVDVAQSEHRGGRIPTNKGKSIPLRSSRPTRSQRSPDSARQPRGTGSGIGRWSCCCTARGCGSAKLWALRPKDVNLEVGSVTMLHGKGDRMRTVGIDRGANPRIEAWIECRRTLDLPADAPLFCTMKGTPIGQTSVNRVSTHDETADDDCRDGPARAGSGSITSTGIDCMRLVVILYCQLLVSNR
jgi:hypothetical protein